MYQSRRSILKSVMGRSLKNVEGSYKEKDQNASKILNCKKTASEGENLGKGNFFSHLNFFFWGGGAFCPKVYLQF
jgi:hypothetical protein